MVDGGKAITFSDWATLAQDHTGWLKLVTKAPFDIGKPQLRPPRCDARVTLEEMRRFLALRRAQEAEHQRRALFNVETDAELTQAWFQNDFMSSFLLVGDGSLTGLSALLRYALGNSIYFYLLSLDRAYLL